MSKLISLREAAKSEGIKLEIESAAENYLDEGFYDHIRSDEVMSINGVLIQLHLNSLDGHYGTDAKKSRDTLRAWDDRFLRL